MAVVAQTIDNPIELQQQGIRRRAPRQYPGDPGLLLNKTQHRSLPNFLDGPINITGIIPFPVNSKYAKPLETPELLEIAQVFSRLECQILAFVRVLVEAEAAKTAYSEKTLQLCSRFEKTRQALDDVHTGLYQFSVDYLKDMELLPAWTVAANAHRDLFGSVLDNSNQQGRDAIDFTAKMFKRLAAPLLEALKSAAGAGCLDLVTRSAIGEKYQNLDVNILRAQTGDAGDLPTWQEILVELRDVPPKVAVPVIKVAAQNMSTTRISLILWITFFSTVVCGGPMLAYAWNFSDHQPGSWAEEDFFFLLQGSIMQVFGLVVTVITLARNKGVPTAAWALPSVLTLVLTVVSPSLYCFVPKWWSSFCTLIAASIQAFLVLQLALYSA